jgi:endonuclease/exonuclease/phosphatase family metal-dependent hydrolase
MNISTLSFNIHKGFNWSNSSFTLHQLKEQIQSTNVDIVFLQEVHGEQKKHEQNIQNWPQESQFEFLADGVWQDYAYAKNAVYDEGDHGNAILSRFPIVFNETINISTNPLEKRGILHCKIENPDTKKSLHLFCVHLNLTHKGRLKQYETIIERIKIMLIIMRALY